MNINQTENCSVDEQLDLLLAFLITFYGAVRVQTAHFYSNNVMLKLLRVAVMQPPLSFILHYIIYHYIIKQVWPMLLHSQVNFASENNLG